MRLMEPFYNEVDRYKHKLGTRLGLKFGCEGGLIMLTVNVLSNRALKGLIDGVLSVSLVFLLSTLDVSDAGLFSSAYAQNSELSTKATIVIETDSSSAATKGRTLKVTHYKDTQCSRPGKTDKLFRKNFADDNHQFKPLVVETDVPFIFQVSYLEKRRNESRSCVAISSVDLKPNRRYSAIFKVVGEVVGCNISVFDVTDSTADQGSENVPIVDAEPELTCAKVGKFGYKSGTPVYSYNDRL